jgi:type IV pilus assembly protein PilY1
VNEVNSQLAILDTALWLGNGGSTTTSFTGMRFTNVAIPKGATIKSAVLQVYSDRSQWISIGLQLSADAADNSPGFTTSSKPSQRTRTTIINHTSNVNWSANIWYSFNDIAGVIQAVVSRSRWNSGNSLSLIIKGTSAGTYGRKFFRSFEGSSTFAPKLVITYTTS